MITVPIVTTQTEGRGADYSDAIYKYEHPG